MPLEERRVEINGLTPGMYVCRLDRPWTETPYPLQGFLVESPADIEQLRRYSSYVYIDVEKSLDRSERGVLLRLGYGLPRGGRPPLPPPTVYRESVPLDEELPKARVAWETMRELATRFVDDLRNGRRISAEEMGRAIEPIVTSVIRNADAFFWLESANASCISRVMPNLLATFSAVMPIGVYTVGIFSMASPEAEILLPIIGTMLIDSAPPATTMSY